MRFLATILSAIALSSCAAPPLVIDLPPSAYKTSPETVIPSKPISNVDIRTTADDGNSVYGGIGADTLVQINPVTKTKQTVESDLRQFFVEAVPSDKASNRSITVTIRKVDSYWVWSAAAKTPIIGLAFANADTAFGMNVPVLIEVEEGGKVVSSYIFDERITIQGKATTRETIEAAYKRLVAEYRRRLYGELEARFVRRYL